MIEEMKLSAPRKLLQELLQGSGASAHWQNLFMEKEGARWCRWSSKMAGQFLVSSTKTPI